MNLAYTIFRDIGYSFGGPEPFRISGLHYTDFEAAVINFEPGLLKFFENMAVALVS